MIVELSSPYSVQLVSRQVRAIDPLYREQVNALWNPLLINTPVVSVLSCDREGIVGELIEYKLCYACSVLPSLSAKLSVAPLCVSGRTFWGDKLLIGRRSGCVSTYRNMWELAPSGGVDISCVCEDGSVDVEGALLAELEQEAAIGPEGVQSITLKWVYYSQEDNTWDVCGDIVLTKDEHPVYASDEYETLVWKDPSQLDMDDTWVPLSRKLLQL